MTYVLRMTSCLIALSALGCSTSIPAIDPCIEFRPITVSRQHDVLTEETAALIFDHNQAWEKICQ